MKLALYPIPFLVVAVFFLIRAEILKERRQIYILKPISTLMVIAIAWLSFLESAHNQLYTIGILVGLLLSLGGDVALMFPDNRKAFTAGLGLFLLAHVAYSVVFLMLGRFSGVDVLSVALLLIAGVGFYTLIKPNLGTMRVPVIVYILVISVMVNRAVSVLAGDVVSRAQGLMAWVQCCFTCRILCWQPADSGSPGAIIGLAWHFITVGKSYSRWRQAILCDAGAGKS